MRYTLKTLIVLTCSLIFPILAQSQPLLRIGVSLPLTGDLSEYGTAVKNGIELARSQNKEGFQQIQFIYEDNRYDAPSSISALYKLRDLDKVNLLYVWGDQPTSVIAPLLRKKPLPTFSLMTDPEPVKNIPSIIRFINPYKKYSATLLSSLRARHLKNIAIISVDDPYFDNLVKGLNAAKLPGESVSVIKKVNPDLSDFRQIITSLRAYNFDVLGVYLNPGQVSAFYRQMKALKVSYPTFGADVFESHTEIKAAEGAMDTAVFANNIVTEAFRKEYLTAFGNDNQITYASNSFDFANLIASSASEIAKDSSINGLTRIFQSRGKIDGASGEIQFIKDPIDGNYFDFPVAVKEIKDGKILLSRTN